MAAPITPDPSGTSPGAQLAEASHALPEAPAAARTLTDGGAVVLAVAAGLGAWWARPLPVAVGVVVCACALRWRRPLLLVLGVGALAAALGHRSEAGLGPPEPGRFTGVVTLVSDPRDTPWGTRADVRVGAKRYEMAAARGAAGTLGRALTGERLRVEGRLRPPPPDAPWLKPRHVVGRLTVERAELHDAGAAPWRAANRFRRLLQRGADVMHEPAGSLYGGFVLGDDRGQRVEVVDDFRAAGLTHLLVVSGSNVAYLLVLAAPLTSRMSLWGRWGATLAIVAAFTVVTRFEPSILRASAMAALAVTTTLAGRPTGSLRVLALAVTGLVLIDPLLVHSVGFQLSVAASLGIVVLARPIAAALPGPTWLGNAVGVTLAAQIGVAPVLVPRFGGMPVVAIVANLVAVPAAGIVTTWGLPAGVVAGILGPDVGRWLHLPTSACIDWVAGTARIAAGLPLGELQTRGLVLIAVAGTGAVVARARGWPDPVRRALVAVAGLALVGPAVALRTVPPVAEPEPGVVVFRSGGATAIVLESAPSPGAVLEALRRAGVRRIDVLVADADPELLRALEHRWAIGRVLDPSAAASVLVGDLWVRVAPNDPDAVDPITVARAPPHRHLPADGPVPRAPVTSVG